MFFKYFQLNDASMFINENPQTSLPYTNTGMTVLLNKIHWTSIGKSSLRALTNNEN